MNPQSTKQLCDSLLEKYSPNKLESMLNGAVRVNQDLYDAVKDNFTEDQLRDYQEMGKSMYDDANFETEIPNDHTTAVAYTHEMIKSGMHPSYLLEEEKNLMEWAYGKEWYTRYGYTAADLKLMETEK